MRRRLIITVCVFLCSLAPVPATGTSLAALGNQADLIVLARAGSMVVNGAGGIDVRLTPTAWLKGRLASTDVEAMLAPSNIMAQFAGRAGRSVLHTPPQSGIWFLRTSSAAQKYEVLPTIQGIYTEMEAFLPVPEWWTAPSTGSLHAILYSALTSWYLSLPSPDVGDDYAFLANFGSGAPPESADAAKTVMLSPKLDNHAIGIAAGIQNGSDECLSILASEIGSLRSSAKFTQITNALSMLYQPHGSGSVLALRELISLHSEAPGLDLAALRALGRVPRTTPYIPEKGPGPAISAAPGTPAKEFLPAVIDVLDSPDDAARRAAAWYLGHYASLADEHGDIVQGSNGPYPFRSEGTERYSPASGSNVPTAECVAFWKQWWAQNRAKLGFPDR